MPYQHKRIPLTLAEQHALIVACTEHEERIVILTLLDCGLRVAELAKLTAADVDFQLHRLTIRGKAGPFGLGAKVRVVPMSERVQRLLEPELSSRGRFRMSARTIQRRVRELAGRAGIQRAVTPHVLRHTFAVTWIRRRGSTPALQRILGHDRLATTEIYLNLSPEDVAREYRTYFDRGDDPAVVLARERLL